MTDNFSIKVILYLRLLFVCHQLLIRVNRILLTQKPCKINKTNKPFDQDPLKINFASYFISLNTFIQYLTSCRAQFNDVRLYLYF